MNEETLKKGFFEAVERIKKLTEEGIRKSEEVTRVAGHRLKRTFLERDRNHAVQILGRKVFDLIETGEFATTLIEGEIEQIRRLDRAIAEEDEKMRNEATVDQGEEENSSK